MARQIGIFFFFLGLIISIVAVASLQAKTPSVSACLLSLLLVGFGLFLIWRNRVEVPASERFKTLKKMREKKK
jgi:hypothetical protein